MYCESAYRPPWWLPAAWQTRLALQAVATPSWQTVELSLDGGRRARLDCIGSGDALVLLLPGFDADSRGVRVASVATALAQAGIRVAVLNRSPIDSPAETDLLDACVRRLASEWPRSLFGILGLSLGGAQLLNWLSCQGEQAPLQAAAAVSVPFRYAVALKALQHAPLRGYQKHLLQQRRAALLASHGGNLPATLRKRIDGIDSLARFDGCISAPLHGFADLDALDSAASCLQRMTTVRVPSLIVQASDDPMAPPAALPRKGELSTYTTLELARSGGHLGFVSGERPWQRGCWLEQRLVQWFTTRLR